MQKARRERKKNLVLLKFPETSKSEKETTWHEPLFITFGGNMAMKTKPVSKPGHSPGMPVPAKKVHLANSIEAANEGTEVIDDIVLRSRLIHLLGESDPKAIKATVYEPVKVRKAGPMPEAANKNEIETFIFEKYRSKTREAQFCSELDAWLGAFDTEKLNKIVYPIDRSWYYIEKRKQSRASRKENGRDEDDYIHKNRPKDWVPRNLPEGWYGQRVPQVKDLLNKAPLIGKKLDAIEQRYERPGVVALDPGARLEMGKLYAWMRNRHYFEPYYPTSGLKKFFYDNRVPTNDDKFCYESALVHGTRYNSYKGLTSRWEHYWIGLGESLEQQIAARVPSDFGGIIKFPDQEEERRCGNFLPQRMRVYKAEIKRYREGSATIENVQRMYKYLFNVKPKVETPNTTRTGIAKDKVLTLVPGKESQFIYEHSFEAEKEVVQERNAKANPEAVTDPLDKKLYSRRELLMRGHIARAEAEIRMTQIVQSELKEHTSRMERLVNAITDRIDKHYESEPLPQGYVLNGSIIIPN